MKRFVLTFSLILSVIVGSAGMHLATGGATESTAHAADSIVGVPIDIDFRCFLCGWAGCTITNSGGSGCMDSPDMCSVWDWGCVEWPSGGFIPIRW